MDLRQTIDGAWYLAEHLLHPARGALSAAGEELAELDGVGDSDSLLLLVGQGLGWHARALLDRHPGANLLIYEPNARTRALAAALGPDLTGAEMIGAEDALLARLSQALVYGTGQTVRLVSAPAYRRAQPELWLKIEALVADETRRARVDQLNRAAKRGQWLGHLEKNIGRLLELPDLTRMAGVYRGRPALVIGAGPSLDQSLPILAAVNPRQLLTIAAASALAPMARLGLAPDLALALEAKDESRQLTAADPGRTLLAAASTAHPHHFANQPGCKALFHLLPWLPKALGQGLPLANGGHVTSAAFTLALIWGCDPVILVGQDLAYSQGRGYAQGRVGGDDQTGVNRREVMAIGGGTVETTVVMAGYIDWYREAAAYLDQKKNGPRLVNATAQGAWLPGFEHLDLATILGELRADGNDFERPLELSRKVAAPPAWVVGQALSQARAELRHGLNVLATGGVMALRQDTANDSAVAEIWDLVGSPASPARARAVIEELIQAITRMAEVVHAHA